MTKAMRPTLRQSTCIIQYNGISYSDLENNVEFVDVDLSCNKLNLWLLANDFITCTKKKHVIN